MAPVIPTDGISGYYVNGVLYMPRQQWQNEPEVSTDPIPLPEWLKPKV